jgi:hypothetical protein
MRFSDKGSLRPRFKNASMEEQPRKVRIIEDRWSTVRHAVESIAIVAAGLWAAYVFIYQERIKPTLEAPSLQLTVTFQPGKTVGATRIAELHILLANTGHVDTDVYADTASVFGDRFAVLAPTPRPSYGPADALVNRMVQTSKRELVYSYATLRDAAVGGSEHISLSPDQHYEFVLPIAVKSGRFDELHADVTIVFGRYRPDLHHFSHVAIVRGDDGALDLKLPAKGNGDQGFVDNDSVQTTL